MLKFQSINEEGVQTSKKGKGKSKFFINIFLKRVSNSLVIKGMQIKACDLYYLTNSQHR